MSIALGTKVKLTKTIFEGNPDLPSSVCGHKNDVVIVKDIYGNGTLSVHHADITDGRSFRVFSGEYFETLHQDMPATNAYGASPTSPT